MVAPADANLLRALCADPGAGPSALSGQAALLIEPRRLALDAAESRRIAHRLREFSCPVLAIAADTEDGALVQAADARVADLESAASLLANIQRSPLAAMVLAQLLRATEIQTPSAALLTESLAYSTLQAGPEYRAWLAQHRAPAPASHADAGPAVLLAREAGTLRLTLNRASRRNAMTVEMRDALIEALQLALADEEFTHIEIDARGKCFSTGGDLTEFGSAPDPVTAHLVRSLALPGRLLAQCAARVSVRVHGACIGSGIEFPAFASHLIATRDAWFQLPELSFGLIPGAGGCVSIPRRIGRQRTAWLVLSGRRIDAETALAWGLVDALATD